MPFLPGFKFSSWAPKFSLPGSQVFLPGSQVFPTGSQVFLICSHVFLLGSHVFLLGSHVFLLGSQVFYPCLSTKLGNHIHTLRRLHMSPIPNHLITCVHGPLQIRAYHKTNHDSSVSYDLSNQIHWLETGKLLRKKRVLLTFLWLLVLLG